MGPRMDEPDSRFNQPINKPAYYSKECGEPVGNKDSSQSSSKRDSINKLASINLALTPNIGPKTFQALVEQTTQVSDIYQFSREQLLRLKVPKKSIDHMISHPPSNPCKDVEQALNWAQTPKHNLLTQLHEHYPEQLKQIATAPPLLMVKGDVACLSLPQVAIVGSRYPTSAGQGQAFEFAHALSEFGFVITSGLARGVDAFAHRGALSGDGKTVAVLGSGLNQIYPKQNNPLAEEIADHGAVISEFPLRAKSLPGHFPRRNRIVSGLSLGTLVIEATIKSGSLITARQALEQNREVFALPGPINNPLKAGCHYLIRQGACLIETPEQIVQELSLISGHVISSHLNVSSDLLGVNDSLINPERDQLQPEQYSILTAVDYEGISLDNLVDKTQGTVSHISAHLMDLELLGFIRQEQGLYFRR
jgi:DNA processing protein